MISSSWALARAGSAGSGSSASKMSGLAVVEGVAGRVEATAITAGQYLLGLCAAYRNQRADAVGLLAALLGEPALRRAVVDVEISRIARIPGDIAWRISTTCPPSRNSAQPASVAAAGVSNITARHMRTETQHRPSLATGHIGMRKPQRKQAGAGMAWRLSQMPASDVGVREVASGPGGIAIADAARIEGESDSSLTISRASWAGPYLLRVAPQAERRLPSSPL